MPPKSGETRKTPVCTISGGPAIPASQWRRDTKACGSPLPREHDVARRLILSRPLVSRCYRASAIRGHSASKPFPQHLPMWQGPCRHRLPGTRHWSQVHCPHAWRRPIGRCSTTGANVTSSRIGASTAWHRRRRRPTGATPTKVRRALRPELRTNQEIDDFDDSVFIEDVLGLVREVFGHIDEGSNLFALIESFPCQDHSITEL